MNPNASPKVRALAERQAGHVTSAQLGQCGFSKATIDNWCRQHALIRVFHGVYAIGHVPRDPRARAWAALLAAGPQASLGGFCAAWLLKAGVIWPGTPEVVVPCDRRPAGIKVSQTKTLLARDVWRIDGLRVTSPARTTLDLFPKLTEKRRARLIRELRMEQKLTIGQLRDVITRNRNHPGALALRAMIGDAQGEPTRSDLEEAFLALVKRYRLPVPIINRKISDHRVDAFFEDAQLIVELDGWATHGWKQAFEEDRATPLEIMADRGVPTLRLSYDQTTLYSARTAEQLKRVLARMTAAQASVDP